MNSIDIFVYAVKELLHKLVGIFLLPVYKETAYFSCIIGGLQTARLRGRVDIYFY